MTPPQDSVSDVERRKAVNAVLGGLLGPLIPDDFERRVTLGNRACTDILKALDALAVPINKIGEDAK